MEQKQLLTFGARILQLPNAALRLSLEPPIIATAHPFPMMPSQRILLMKVQHGGPSGFRSLCLLTLPGPFSQASLLSVSSAEF